jgi:ferric-dicitrate binding protein FerR (iron transport regulator)
MNPLRLRLWLSRLKDRSHKDALREVTIAWRENDLSNTEAETVIEALGMKLAAMPPESSEAERVEVERLVASGQAPSADSEKK